MKNHREKNQPDSISPFADEQEMARLCRLMNESEVIDCDLLFSGSNHVFLTTLRKDKDEYRAIYKPRRGEAPLWDFPDGTLYKREYASFLVSRALGWYLIPPTIIRDGPYGVGSVQWYIDAKERVNYQLLATKYNNKLKKVAVFDYVVNNADRKGGHFLEGKDGRLWLVDHGLTFNHVPKLRTVLWDFSGQPVPEQLISELGALQRKLRKPELRDALASLLDEKEIKAMEWRLQKIINDPVFTHPTSHRSVPWPWV